MFMEGLATTVEEVNRLKKKIRYLDNEMKKYWGLESQYKKEMKNLEGKLCNLIKPELEKLREKIPSEYNVSNFSIDGDYIFLDPTYRGQSITPAQRDDLKEKILADIINIAKYYKFILEFSTYDCSESKFTTLTYKK